ncbi:sporulation protein YqfD [Paenibacillus chartarius]|uniref:Sporulation protein YqfD n=1 Tax=Paenibacillus chartarius TaxID=747481 RepID=A0ABV6DHG4_9BACL
MQSKLLFFVRGYVRMDIRGNGVVELLNRAAVQRIAVWEVKRIDKHAVSLYMPLHEALRLRPLLRETGCRMRVRERFGFPFMTGMLWRRKFFAVGLAGFIAGIILLSSLVWRVGVEGNQTIATDQIIKAAREIGIKPWQWKSKLGEPDELSRQLHLRLPGTAWVGVEVKGTHVLIKVVEAQLPDQRELVGPRHLVSAKNAMITQIFAEKGLPVVQPNRYVRKGDILITGILGDEENQQTVAATGVVRGLVWYTSSIEVPMVQRSKVYTGESKDRHFFVVGNRGIQLTGYGKVPFAQSETVADRTQWQLGPIPLPFGWLRERVYAVDTAERTIDAAEAHNIALERGRSQTIAAAGPDAMIRSEKILHEKTENGKVYMEVHFEVEENIAIEQSIVP